jgi:hypothetical protein
MSSEFLSERKTGSIAGSIQASNCKMAFFTRLTIPTSEGETDETDETENFVGYGICVGSSRVGFTPSLRYAQYPG